VVESHKQHFCHKTPISKYVAQVSVDPRNSSLHFSANCFLALRNLAQILGAIDLLNLQNNIESHSNYHHVTFAWRFRRIRLRTSKSSNHYVRTLSRQRVAGRDRPSKHASEFFVPNHVPIRSPPKTAAFPRHSSIDAVRNIHPSFWSHFGQLLALPKL